MDYFTIEHRGETCLVTLTNPPYNSLHAELFDEGTAMLRDLAKDPPAGGVVLTGAGDNFTRGMDIKIAAAFTEADADRTRLAINRFCAALHQLPCPLVCAVNGHSIGAGGIVMLCADWVVTAEGEHKIGLPEAKAGLPFPTVPQAILDHWLDPVWRRRLALTSVLLGPHQAVEAGIADEVVAADGLLDHALARAAELASQPAFAACKQQLRAKADAEINGLIGE